MNLKFNTSHQTLRRLGFTLVELLVVIAIVGLLSSVAVVATTASREKARLASGIAYEATLNRSIGLEAAAIYDFEEGAGTATADASNNNNGGTISNATWSTDTYGTASARSLSFASGNYVATAKGLGIATSNFTIALWIKTASTNSQMYIVNNTGSGDGFRFGLTAGLVSFLIGNGPNTEGGCGSKAVNDNKWHHIVGEFDRTSSVFRCYVDGHLSGTIATGSYPTISDGVVRIGTTACCTAFVGLLDDVRVYRSNLSGVSIQNIYNEKARFFALRN